jgi:hypothetical protein
MEIVKKSRECAYNIESKNSICMDNITLQQVSKFANLQKNIKTTDPIELIKILKNVYNCKTEACLLKTSEISENLGASNIKAQLDTRFKPEGPHDSYKWFSNHNIDDVLHQISINKKNKDFLHIFFQMRDFQKYNTKLANINFVEKYKEGFRKFGVVFNTDYSTGNGQHWFAVYGDFTKEPFTIEYFNSSGHNPLPEISSWMSKVKHHMVKELHKKVEDIIVSKNANQKDNHSCGSYSLFYIISRLNNVPYKYFTNTIIGDTLMHEFRKNLFRHTN